MNIETKTKETISKYKLLNKKDKVVVALSGGKDSTSILYILHKLGYKVQALMIDLYLGNWSRKNKTNMEKFCSELNIKLTIIDLKKELGSGICFIKSVLKEKQNLTGCAVCGVIKKYLLNKWAKKLKADKIVTGHNLDDEAQTIFMNFLKGNILLGANSTPATGTPIKGFVQRVKPFFFVPESEIKKYSLKNKLPALYERCPCAFGTYRVETRAWLNKIPDKQKLKIVKNFQKQIPKLQAKLKTHKTIQKCTKCGEPASGEICSACKIFTNLK